MKISIVTAVWNRAETIRSALESVARQKRDGFDLEHILVDGGSTDGTVDVLRTYAADVRRAAAERCEGDSAGRFTVRWVSERDRGLYDAINKGIRLATGDVIGLVHSDDVLAEDDTLARIAQAFRAEVDATYADVRFVVGGRTLDEIRRQPTRRYCTGRFFRRWMFRFATFPAHPSTFVRRACFEKYGLYSLDYPICADFELMLRLFVTHRIRTRYLPICTHVMRMGGLSTGGFRSNVAINSQDLRALRANGVWSCLPLIYLKYLFKVWGFVFRRQILCALSSRA